MQMAGTEGNRRDVHTTLNYYPADCGPPIPVIVGESVAPVTKSLTAMVSSQD